MALSLKSIYTPLMDFFLQKFGGTGASTLLFRFDKLSTALTDEDFILPRFPVRGYSDPVAMERFSRLVNHIPIDAGDDMSIVLNATSAIDSTYYFRLLAGSEPYLPNNLSTDQQNARIQAFNELKAEAQQTWTQVGTRESLTGLMLDYKPSLATPNNWGDVSNSTAWTNYSFQVSESATEESNRIWKLKLPDPVMREALRLPKPPLGNNDPGNVDPPRDLARRVFELNEHPGSVLIHDLGVLGAAHSLPSISSTHFPGSHGLGHLGLGHGLNALTTTASVLGPTGVYSLGHPIIPLPPNTVDFEHEDWFTGDVNLYDKFVTDQRKFDVNLRIELDQFITIHAPSVSTKTSTFSISFDYCVVQVNRPWYFDAFVNHKSWCIPTTKAGEVTATGVAGNLSMLPIAFVAIRNLEIEANWAAEDVRSASRAIAFGPFRVTTINSSSSKISHKGLQIVGWVLQKLPSLPPNSG